MDKGDAVYERARWVGMRFVSLWVKVVRMLRIAASSILSAVYRSNGVWHQ